MPASGEIGDQYTISYRIKLMAATRCSIRTGRGVLARIREAGQALMRNGDRQSFMKSVAEDPKLLNARGPEGSTPFMYAVLYSDAATLEAARRVAATLITSAQISA